MAWMVNTGACRCDWHSRCIPPAVEVNGCESQSPWNLRSTSCQHTPPHRARGKADCESQPSSVPSLLLYALQTASVSFDTQRPTMVPWCARSAWESGGEEA